jgi:hypothetical protein
LRPAPTAPLHIRRKSSTHSFATGWNADQPLTFASPSFTIIAPDVATSGRWERSTVDIVHFSPFPPWCAVLAMFSSPVFEFFLANVLLIAGLLLLIFVYLVLLIRKRWKNNFLHPQETGKK